MYVWCVYSHVCDGCNREKEDGKKKKPKKDPDAPKGALSSFIIFGNENRARLKDENPTASFQDLGRIIGEKWKAMTKEEQQVRSCVHK